ncbi:MAG: hypothetical protein LCH30_09485 [Proteobacteria bacterium]|nr:hypothetical protein [Pseudomonadota bacterium]
MKRLFFSCVLAGFSLNTFAFTCYFTAAKDSCWQNYDVNIKVMDAIDNKEVMTVVLPKGKPWVRQTFECQPSQKLMYEATYQPVFWKTEEGKSYMALRYWTLPEEIGKAQSAWEISVCFPADFAAVPLPPEASGTCQCNFKDIPAIPPAKAE